MFVSNLTRMPPKDSVNLDINHEVNKLDGKFSHSGKNVKTQGVKKISCISVWATLLYVQPTRQENKQKNKYATLQKISMHFYRTRE